MSEAILLIVVTAWLAFLAGALLNDRERDRAAWREQIKRRIDDNSVH